ncbi:class I lanthipeptide [Taibaiella helva]|uniref:class I lanthipeptide n=1 Tax=Taibaiella helva TaxID=2301235 RepID=UPI0013007403|nr:class I lanthipeptide [Taibaiella helva]
MKKRSIPLKGKLILKKETLARLSKLQQGAIAGGDRTYKACLTKWHCSDQPAEPGT